MWKDFRDQRILEEGIRKFCVGRLTVLSTIVSGFPWMLSESSIASHSFMLFIDTLHHANLCECKNHVSLQLKSPSIFPFNILFAEKAHTLYWMEAAILSAWTSVWENFTDNIFTEVIPAFTVIEISWNVNSNCADGDWSVSVASSSTNPSNIANLPACFAKLARIGAEKVAFPRRIFPTGCRYLYKLWK